MITLNEDQAKAEKDLLEFLYAPGEYLYLVDGPAGTGKSTMISQVLTSYQSQNPTKELCLTAPTNKAVKVLMEMAFESQLKCFFATIHSILGVVVTSDQEEKATRKVVEGHFDSYDLIVIDEISMLTKYMWTLVDSHARENKVKVIMMGDRKQLPPPKEGESLAFANTDRSSTLTQIMRQTEGNPILDLTAQIRAKIDFGQRYALRTTVSKDQGVHCLNSNEWDRWVMDNFTSEEYANNPNEFRCLAWTNERVRGLNRRIRMALLGKTETPFIVGERVLARQPILDRDDETGGVAPVIRTDEECEVIEVYKGVHPWHQYMEDIPVWVFTLHSDRGALVDTYTVHPEGKKRHRQILDKLSSAAKKDNRQWSAFWGFKDSFADIQAPHALTVHKSQGSTYNNVFVDVVNIMRNRDKKEREQLLYVAISRARENAVLLTQEV